MKGDLFISAVCERDIDILLQEEFFSSKEFCFWFATKLNLSPLYDDPLFDVKRSVTQNIGESDLEVTFLTSRQRKIKVLIENKITAGFQPRQSLRYRERGDYYVSRGECDEFLTVLVAPRKYLEGYLKQIDFDRYLAYEDVLDYFKDRLNKGYNDKRIFFKVYLLKRALEKSTIGYQPKEDAVVTNFWFSYWKLSLELTPELRMVQPKSKPSGAGFIYFKPPEFPRNICIVHKLIFGNLDIQFHGYGNHLNDLREKYRKFMLPGMRIEKAHKSGVIRVKVPVVDPGKEFELQKQKVKEALLKAKDLYIWFLTVDKNI